MKDESVSQQFSLCYWEWQEHDWHHVTNPNQLISLASYKAWMSVWLFSKFLDVAKVVNYC
jgi:hypothetical protein